MTNDKHSGDYGNLYVVATPIGNKADITLRALDVLKHVDIIAAEDTRTTGRFLSAYDIKGDLISYHEHNEEVRTPALIKKLKKGDSIALLSNAGTPLVSDPGYRLVNEAIANKVKVIPVPGVCAAISALSVSGLPMNSFIFAGFPARKKGKRIKQLKTLANDTRTIVLYESPKRIIQLLEEIVEILGDRPGILAREMTKIHEEFIRGPITEIIECMKQRPAIKGEVTLLLAGQKEEAVPMELVKSEVQKKIKKDKNSISDISKRVADKYGISKRKVYEIAVAIKEKQ
jgi:16S rRNA (cytidine1402-2'-O)-methyltransferase